MAGLRIPRTLKRGVGRKILGIFLLAGILPVAFTASLAYFEVHRGMEEEINRTLRMSAKDYGLDLLGRLKHAAGAADDVERIYRRDGAAGLEGFDYLLSDFDGIWFMDKAGKVSLISGAVDLALNPDVFAAEHATAIEPGLLITRGKDDGLLTLLRPIDSDPSAAGMLVLQLNAVRIWGDQDDNPYRTNFCVYSTRGTRLSLFATYGRWLVLCYE